MPGYSVQDFEDPLYSLLVRYGVSTVAAEEYDVLASVDADTLVAYAEAALEKKDNGPGSWDGFLLALKELEQSVEHSPSPPPPPPPEGDNEEGETSEGHENEDEAEYGTQQHEEDDAVGDSQEPPWKCTRCMYPSNPYVNEVCDVCNASYWHEDEPLTASSVLSESQHTLELLIRADDLPVPGCTLVSFTVKKRGSGGASSLFSRKVKERIVKVDFCGQRFLNCDPADPSRHSVSLDSKHLYRVEKRFVPCARLPTESTAEHVVRVYFFKTAHPIDLEFANGVDCRRFIELASLHRKHPVVWAPSLCRGNKREAVLRVFDERSVRRGVTTVASPRDLPSVTVSRVSHEIVRFWVGALDVSGGDDLGPSSSLRAALGHHGADVFVISLLGVGSSSSWLKSDGAKKIQELFETLCGADFYTVLNSLADMNPFANASLPPASYQSGESALVVLLLVRRSHLSKLSHIDVQRVDDRSHSKNRGIVVSFDVQESSIACLVASTDVDEDTMDTEEKHARLRSLLGNIRCGDPSIDVSHKFDYLFVTGKLGYSATCVRGEWSDELLEALPVKTFLVGFSEDPGVVGTGSTTRILSWRRETGTCSKTLAYSPLSSLIETNGVASKKGEGCWSNSSVRVADVFCLRTYVYGWCVPVPAASITVRHVRISLNGLVGGTVSTGGGVSASPSISSSSVVLTSRCADQCPMIIPSKQYNSQGASAFATIHAEVPVLKPVVPSLEWIALQHLVFSVRGLCPFVTYQETEVVASASIPLRVACGSCVGHSVEFSAPLMRHTAPIGTLECTILIAFRGL